MKIRVCELPNEASRKEAVCAALAHFLRANPTDVVVLPEMPFCDWQMFMTKTIDPHVWNAALAVHDAMIARFPALQAAIVLASRPVDVQGKRLNQAFCWTQERGYRGAYTQYYLPDEPDGWEATWFAQGDRQCAPIVAGSLTVGFQLCTELLFTEPAREIGRGGAHFIAAPRATSGHRRWPMATCMAAVMSGCFVASATRRSYESAAFAGRSWLVSPEGEILAETSVDTPFLTVDIDFEEAIRAKSTYPRNLPIP
ncbi:MAG: carbon-nitrogen hydrolase family protein [Candidatus Tectimicrobiota bacterium]